MMIEVLGREEFDALRDKNTRVHWFLLNEPYTYMVNGQKHSASIHQITISLTSLVRELRGDHFETHVLRTGIYVGEAVIGTDSYSDMVKKAEQTVKQSWPTATWGRWE